MCDFPTDRYDGFAVECEWVLHLLISGAAVHVPRPLYLKRIFGPNEISASAKRLLGRSREHLFEALEDHRARMLALIRQADLPKTMRDTVELAAEAAMLRRHMTFNMGAFLSGADRTVRSNHQSYAGAMPGRYGKGIQAMTPFGNVATCVDRRRYEDGDWTWRWRPSMPIRTNGKDWRISAD